MLRLNDSNRRKLLILAVAWTGCCALLAQESDLSGRVELQAESWINPPSIRIPEDRTLILYFFSTVQEREKRSEIDRLNSVARRDDVLVIGLSAESKVRVEKFVDSNKIRFPVGTKSTTYRRFRVRKLPQIIVIPPRDCSIKAEVERLDFDALVRRFPPPAHDGPLDELDFDEHSSTDVLRFNASGNQDRSESLRALGLLRSRIPTDEFLKFCDELLDTEQDFFRRGNIHFQRNLADPAIPAEEKEPLLEPATEAMHLNRETLDDPQWEPLREFMDRRDTLTVDQLFDEYLAHQGRSPSDLLIRKSAADAVAGQNEKKRVREILMQMLPAETDAKIRMTIVFGFASTCEPGDVEAADFIEQHLQVERNYRSTRPAMEYVIRYLRTGEE